MNVSIRGWRHLAIVVSLSLALPLTAQEPTSALDALALMAHRQLQAGQLTAAQDDYARLIARDPHHLDALLALAALAQQRGDVVGARQHLLAALTIDPGHPGAQAAMALYLPDSESRLTSLADQYPTHAAVSFSLGNRMARDARWREARQAYVNACQHDPGNPDYRFNLAVTLDHLNQATLALENYRQALVDRNHRAASFDPDSALRRIAQIQALP